jgi:YHS domain-containing protein
LIEVVEVGKNEVASTGRQVLCPVMKGDEVDAASEVVEYKGVKVLLCCKKCVRRWKANPEKYADVGVLPQLAGVRE